jgi:hypothetical protein
MLHPIKTCAYKIFNFDMQENLLGPAGPGSHALYQLFRPCRPIGQNHPQTSTETSTSLCHVLNYLLSMAVEVGL